MKQRNNFLSFSTIELFHKFLVRMEKDYNPREYKGNFVKDVGVIGIELKQ